jgi:hypothetical protein
VNAGADLYFVHDLADPAVHRRVRMLIWGQSVCNNDRVSAQRKPIDRPRPHRGRHARQTGAHGRLDVCGQAFGARMSFSAATSRCWSLQASFTRLAPLWCVSVSTCSVCCSRMGHVAPRSDCCNQGNGKTSVCFQIVRSRLWQRGFAAPIRLVENKMLRIEDGDALIGMRNRPPGPPSVAGGASKSCVASHGRLKGSQGTGSRLAVIEMRRRRSELTASRSQTYFGICTEGTS